jgi:uncharacterized protein YjiS (DUF1127 family)
LKELTMSQSISSKSSDFRMAVRPVRGLLNGLRRLWATQREARLLEELSDHHLRDLGIRREQIPHILKNGWLR